MHPSDSQQSYAPPASPALHGNVPGAPSNNAYTDPHTDPYSNGDPAGQNGTAPHGMHAMRGMHDMNGTNAMNGTNGHHDSHDPRRHDPRPADDQNLRPGARPTGMSYKFQRLR